MESSKAFSEEITTIRKTCKFFRKSAVGWSYLEQEQIYGGKIVALRLGLDVKRDGDLRFT